MSNKLLLGIGLVVLVIVGGWLAFSTGSQDGLANLSANAKLTDSQVQLVINQITKFMVVPSDEKPSVVVLSNVEALAAQQPFYKDAKDGDILVVYSTRAIVYDPKSQKLVSVSPIQRTEGSPAPVASGSAQVSPSASASPSSSPVAPEKVTVDVRNGTAIAGLAGSTASDLKKNTWVKIGAVGDAKGSYTATTLVDLSGGKKPGAIAELERILKVKAVSELPKGESTTTADILVIVGK
jgi:hypothetical protein